MSNGNDRNEPRQVLPLTREWIEMDVGAIRDKASRQGSPSYEGVD